MATTFVLGYTGKTMIVILNALLSHIWLYIVET